MFYITDYWDIDTAHMVIIIIAQTETKKITGVNISVYLF